MRPKALLKSGVQGSVNDYLSYEKGLECEGIHGLLQEWNTLSKYYPGFKLFGTFGGIEEGNLLNC